jgi:tetratricopeptide (TPR) repeat protein
LKWYKKIEKFEFNDVVNLSYLYIKTNNLVQAKDVLTRALIKYENETHLLYNLAIVYVKEKDYSKARECLFKVLNSPVEEDLKAKTLRLLNYIGY